MEGRERKGRRQKVGKPGRLKSRASQTGNFQDGGLKCVRPIEAVLYECPFDHAVVAAVAGDAGDPGVDRRDGGLVEVAEDVAAREQQAAPKTEASAALGVGKSA